MLTSFADVEIASNGDLYAAGYWDYIYRSTDGGTTWDSLTVGLPNSGYGRIEIATAPK